VKNDVILVLVVITALSFDFTNGFHDTGNAMATSIATGALSPRVAVALSGLLNLVGAFLSLAVAATIASGLVNTADVTLTVVAAGLAGGIIWNLITWLFGIPSSSSHALIGGVIGATLAAAGGSAVKWHGLTSKVIIPAALSPIIELVEPRHRLAAGHGYSVPPGEPPGHPELIRDLPAQPENVTGFVREQVPRILVPGITARKACPYPVDPAIAVRVEQAAGQPARICHHNGALPWLQFDRAHVLPARPVLREKTRPVFGTAHHFGTADHLLGPDLTARPNGAHGALTLPPEPRPGVRAHDAQFPYLFVPHAGRAYAAIPQVEAKQVCVVGLRFRERRVSPAPGTDRTRAGANFRMFTPVAQRRP